jgi:hypothetical protein
MENQHLAKDDSESQESNRQVQPRFGDVGSLSQIAC